MAEDPKAELYRFVKDRHDKFLQVRQGQKARIGHLLVVTGFIRDGSSLVGLPNLIAMRNANTWPLLTVAVLAAVTYVVTLGLLTLALREHLRFLGRIGFALPYADPLKIMHALDAKQIKEGHVYKSLTKAYLEAIHANEMESAYAGRHLRLIVRYLSAAMVSGIVFLVLLVFSKMLSSAITQ